MLALAALRVGVCWCCGAAGCGAVRLSRHPDAISSRADAGARRTAQTARPPGTALRVLLFNASRGRTSTTLSWTTCAWDGHRGHRRTLDVMGLASINRPALQSSRSRFRPRPPTGRFFRAGQPHWPCGFHLPGRASRTIRRLVGDVIIASPRASRPSPATPSRTRSKTGTPARRSRA